MSTRDLDISPTAKATLAIYEAHGLAEDINTIIARVAVKAGLGDVRISRLSLTLNLDGEPAALHPEVTGAKEGGS